MGLSSKEGQLACKQIVDNYNKPADLICLKIVAVKVFEPERNYNACNKSYIMAGISSEVVKKRARFEVEQPHGAIPITDKRLLTYK